MCEVQALLDDLSQTFNKYKEQRRVELLKLFGQVRCCDCGHKIRMLEIQEKKVKCPTKSRKLLTACFVLLLSILLFAIFLTRGIHNTNTYGHGSCVNTFFYPAAKCDILV